MSSRYHHGDLRRALLGAADELLGQVGFQGFTLRACARLAGVSHAAPKHHFHDARGLLTAVAERGYARLVARLQSELAKHRGDLVAEMQATCTAYVGFATDYPEHFRIMFRSDLLEIDHTCPPDPVADTFIELTNVILRQRGEAEVDPANMNAEKSAALISDILLGWCYIHGYAHLKLEGQLAMVPDQAHATQLAMAAERLSFLITSTRR